MDIRIIIAIIILYVLFQLILQCDQRTAMGLIQPILAKIPTDPSSGAANNRLSLRGGAQIGRQKTSEEPRRRTKLRYNKCTGPCGQGRRE